jgi:hypothetical protein
MWEVKKKERTTKAPGVKIEKLCGWRARERERESEREREIKL